MKPEEKLAAMGIELVEAPKPVASYVPGIIEDNWAYVSGQLPFSAGELQYKGRLGENISEEDGYKAARLCAVNCLLVLKSLLGNLDRVQKIIKLTGFVRSAPGFTQQPAVINGASDLLSEVFGEAGKHARSAVGVPELPLGAAVEIELIAKVN
jgi:enamine deaminase RidA (YjgF/YER057c/UK114 family)